MSIFKIQNGNFFQPNSLTSIFALSNVRGGLVNTLKRCKPLCTRHWHDVMLKKQNKKQTITVGRTCSERLVTVTPIQTDLQMAS